MGSNQFEGSLGGRSRQGQQPGCWTWDWRKVQLFIKKASLLHVRAGIKMFWPKKGRCSVSIVCLKGDEDRLGRCLSRGLHMHHCIHGHRGLLVEWEFVNFWLLRDLLIRLRVINMPRRFAMKIMFKSSRRSWPRKKNQDHKIRSWPCIQQEQWVCEGWCVGPKETNRLPALPKMTWQSN